MRLIISFVEDLFPVVPKKKNNYQNPSTSSPEDAYLLSQYGSFWSKLGLNIDGFA